MQFNIQNEFISDEQVEFQYFQIVQRVLEKGSSEVTFLERMIRVSQENDDFTIEDVKAEANNALIAVRYS